MAKNAVNFEVTSTEDERQVNHKKMRDAFIFQLKRYLAGMAALKHWQIKADYDEQTRSMQLGSDKESFTLTFKKDGLSIAMDGKSDKAIDAVVATMDCYQQAHDEFHPKAHLEFELICNDEQEARNIIAKAKAQHINITSLKFYNYEKDKKGEALPDINQNKLLAQILSEIPKPSPQPRPR